MAKKRKKSRIIIVPKRQKLATLFRNELTTGRLFNTVNALRLEQARSQKRINYSPLKWQMHQIAVREQSQQKRMHIL